MPIHSYAEAQTVIQEVGKVYAYDRTAYRPVAKVNCFNGTTYRDIWSSEVEIYPSTPVGNKGVNVGTYGAFYSNAPSGANQNSTVVYISIDVTSLKTLKITATKYEGWSGIWLIYPNDSPELQRYPYYYLASGNATTRLKTTSFNGEFSWNVSGFTGIMHLCIGAYSNLSPAAGVSITKVIGIE